MSFENAEKKIEITFKQGSKSLKILPKSFWDSLAAKAKVRILSSVNSPLCDSYLLSESSLFVFPQKLLLITSGQQTLVPVVEHILSSFKIDDLDSFFYEVKGSSYENSFMKEVLSLSSFIPGTLINLGEKASHQVSLFYMERPATLLKNSEATFEVLMHKLDSRFQEVFSLDKASARKAISENPGFKSFFESFDVQDFSFQPFGYSLNSIKGDKYFTLHVSPRERASFASIETNFTDFGADKLLDASFSLFRPQSLQLVAYSPHKEFNFPICEGFKLKAQARKRLGNGFSLQFFDFQSLQEESFLEEIQLSKVFTHKISEDISLKTLEEDKIETPTLNQKNELSSEALSVFGEMCAHVPLFVHPNPFRVLIVGDTRLSITQEVLKHDSVQECLLVQSNQSLFEENRLKFSDIEKSSQDSRLTLKFQEVTQFIQEPEHQFDVILLSEETSVRREEEFFLKLKELLAPGGVLVCDALCPLTQSDEQKSLKADLLNCFSKVFFYTSMSFSQKKPLQIFVYASDNYHPVEEFDREKALKSKINFYYYNSEIHYASFFLPTFIRKNLSSPKTAEFMNDASSADLTV